MMDQKSTPKMILEISMLPMSNRVEFYLRVTFSFIYLQLKYRDKHIIGTDNFGINTSS